MSAVFKKLNFKGQTDIGVVNAPASFEPEIATLRGVSVQRSLAAGAPLAFSLVFVTKQPEVDGLAKAIAKRTVGDAVVWFAYPKQSSKKYESEIDRDHGWAALGAAGFEPVRMVAIDEDWSAVRFRRVDFIKTLNRPAEYALSKAGKAKAGTAAPTKTRKAPAARKTAAAGKRKR
jgi:hypothetical protein